ncbi:hypothetical protein GOQ30_13455 [Flavobacterium sp. TP390]|uniref:Uncharacterized protein n=1 Tax=Flavobacterium profundi TaxID=1774945 RepID=A0A6I4ITI2_9FLAO|nr:hypothetical protein [Flavobacterium profundi]MVO10173.1 hypothetical protein [Flavobacterium profundi]
MKNTILILLLIFGIKSQAQLVQGEIKINNQSKAELTIKSNKAVNLYADFRENKYKINFVFTGTDIQLNTDKKEVVQFVFNTTIKRDGKVIASMKRAPIPFFPGDMLMPVETFDFISMLANLQTNSNETISEMPKGNYEITIEAKALGIKGEIAPARFFINL